MRPGFHIIFIVGYPALQQLIFLLLLAERGAKDTYHVFFSRAGEAEQLFLLIFLRRVQKCQKCLLTSVFTQNYHGQDC